MGKHSLPLIHPAPSLSKSALQLSPCSCWAGPKARWFDEDKVDKLDMTQRNDGVLFHHCIDQFNKGIAFDTPGEPVAGWLKHAIRYLTVELGPRCDTIQSEVAIGINWTSGDVLIPQDVQDRKYPDMPEYEWGTADVVGILSNGGLYIADWKTGTTEGAKDQLKSLACGFQAAITTEGCSVRPVTIACLSVNEHGVWADEQEVTQTELTNHNTAMRIAWEDYKSGNVTGPIPGIHCTALYCPHLAYCDAHKQTVAVEGGKEVKPVAGLDYTDKPATDKEAGYTMALISAARRGMKYTEAKLKDYCSKGGRVISGSQEWKERSNGWRWGRIGE